MKTSPTVEDSLERIREGLDRRVASLGGRVGDHLASAIGRPGKMLRARYALALGAALGVERGACERLGRAVELVHNASLLQDDCIDQAALRRGEPTPNAQFGDRTGILLGDLAFVEAMTEAGGISASAVGSLVRAVREMTVGALQEEFLYGSLNVSEEGYYGVAARKTGALFEWMGTVLSEVSPLDHRREDPPRLGRIAGMLLQIIDDIHDFTLDGDTAGKPPGQDLANGRLTLPGILAMDDEVSRPRFLELWERRGRGVQRGAAPSPARSEEAFGPGGGVLKETLALFEERGHLEAARERGRDLMKRALPLVEALPVADEAAGLRGFLELMLGREF